MSLSITDRTILCWTIKNDYDARYEIVGDGGPTVLVVDMRWSSARFERGRLIAIKPGDPNDCQDAFVLELAKLFALCGHLEMMTYEPPDVLDTRRFDSLPGEVMNPDEWNHSRHFYRKYGVTMSRS